MKVKEIAPVVFIFSLLFIFPYVFMACGKGATNPGANSGTNPGTNPGTMENQYTGTMDELQAIPAVCIREVNFRAEPGVNGARKNLLVPGLALTFLGRIEKGPVSKTADGDWYFVELPGNDRGWVLADAVVPAASPAVMTTEAFAYSLPDELALIMNYKLVPMDIIAILEERKAWMKIVLADWGKARELWIKPGGYSSSEIDMAVALKYKKETAVYEAKKDKNVYKKALTALLNVPGYRDSIFAPGIDEVLLTIENEPAAEQAAIQAAANPLPVP